MKASLLLLMSLVISPLFGCISSSAQRGLEPRWREAAPTFEAGKTTRSEVLEALGPPSQILSLETETAFYYLLEKTEQKGLILFVYNQQRERTVYERAVFFFDADGVLTDFALGGVDSTDDE